MYCNTGYTLLAEIVKRVSGKSFDEFTRLNIFVPLRMINTHFHMDHEEIVKNRAYSYNTAGKNNFKNAVLSYANGGATSLFTNIDDMSKWINNFSDPVVGGKQAIDQMMERGILNNGTKIDYAFGLGLGAYRGLNRISHDGGDAGFRTNVTIFPDQKFAIIVFANVGDFNPGEYTNKIADIYLADKLTKDATPGKPKEHKEVAINNTLYNQYTGTYQLFPGFTLTVTNEKNTLMVQATGQKKFEVYPESETNFFYKIVDAQITFDNPVNGKCSKLILHQNGSDMPGKKVDVVKPSIEELKEYEGNYYSDELGTTINLVVIDSSLTFLDRRNPDLKLDSFGKDTFSAGPAVINFQRNNENKICSLLVTTERVRNLKFSKI